MVCWGSNVYTSFGICKYGGWNQDDGSMWFISWSNEPFPIELQASQGFGRCHKSSTWSNRTGAHRLNGSNRPAAVPESKHFNTARGVLVWGLVQRQNTGIQTLCICRVVLFFRPFEQVLVKPDTTIHYLCLGTSWFQVLAGAAFQSGPRCKPTIEGGGTSTIGP